MRIVHEFHGKDPQCTGTGKHYASEVSGPPKWTGFHVEVMGVDAQQKPKFVEGEAIYIEGDGEAVKKLLQSMLQCVLATEKRCRENFELEKANTLQCKHGNWFMDGMCTDYCTRKEGDS